MPSENAALTSATRHRGARRSRSTSAMPKGTNSTTFWASCPRMTVRDRSKGHARMRSSKGIQVHGSRPDAGWSEGRVARRMMRTDVTMSASAVAMRTAHPMRPRRACHTRDTGNAAANARIANGVSSAMGPVHIG